MINTTPYFVPREPGRWRAITLAALVHAVLFAFLWVGIRWQNQTPVAVEAEIWSPVAQEAAPMAEPQAAEKSAPEPEIRPEPAPEPVARPLPQPDLTPRPIVQPEIALAQEKKRKALKELQERLQEEQQQKKVQKQKAEQQRLLEEELRHAKLLKQEQERLKKQKIADEKLAEKLAEKEREKAKEQADALAKKKRAADDAKKIAADKKRKQDAAEEAQLAKLRDDDMRRLTGATGSGGNGTAAKSQGSGSDTGYANKIGAKIRSNTIFNVPDDLTGNPSGQYEIPLYPDGSTGEIRVKKSSGVPGFDEAVKRAIKKSEPFPRDKSGNFPPSITLTHKLKDQ